VSTTLISVLKVIPWEDVIRATPQIVSAAKKLFAKTKAEEAAAAVPSAPTEAEQRATLDLRLGGLQQRVEELSKDQASSAELLKALAEQNARVVEAIAEQNARLVEAIEALRRRTTWLGGASAVLAAAVIALASYLVVR
jgi:small-conductance mechanosensitive channel